MDSVKHSELENGCDERWEAMHLDDGDGDGLVSRLKDAD